MKHIDKIRRQIAENEELVMLFTGLGKEDYSVILYGSAENWASRFIDNPEAEKYILFQQSFWGWWKLQIDRINATFIQSIHYDADGCFYLQIADYHNNLYRYTKQVDICSIYKRYVFEHLVHNDRVDRNFHQFLKNINVKTA